MFDNQKKPYFITFCSGKGGVGKSVIAANLAEWLSEESSVLLWDADIYFPNQHLIMGVEPPVRLNRVYEGKVNAQTAAYSIDDNFDLLADVPAAGMRTGIDIKKFYNVFEELKDANNYEYVLLDTPAGGIIEILECAMFSDMTCLIITDEPTSLLDCYGLIKILIEYIDSQKLFLLVNNVIDSEDADEISKKLNMATEKFLGVNLEYLGYVPYDRCVRQSIIQQKLLLNLLPNSDVAAALGNIGARIELAAKNRLNEKSKVGY